MKAFPYLAKGEPLDLGPGIHRGLSREDYDRLPSINQSTLKKWIDIVILKGGCPKKFKHWFDHRNDGEMSEPLLLGSALDCLILEPDAFIHKFIVEPDKAPKRPTAKQLETAIKKGDHAVIEAAAFWESFDEEANGKLLLSDDQNRRVLGMRDSLAADEKTADVWKYCQKTVLQANLEGFPCKGEVDLFANTTEFLFDLKTTRDASRNAFGKSAWDLGYHIQAAFYLKLCEALGLDKRAFSFIAVENEEPYCVAAYTIDWTSDALQYAWKLCQQSFVPLDYHFGRNTWPDFGDFEPITFPKYTRREIVDFLGTSL